MKTTIVTHPGRAHRDDFLAVCWLLGDVTDSPEVYRREPTQEDLNDSTVYVLDIGGQYDPRFRNFDHHQLPADSPPTCALQLLLEYELGAEAAHHTFPWLFSTGLFDSKGPRAVAEHFGIPIKSLGELASPLEAMILEMFADVAYLHPNDVLHKTMTQIGLAMWDRAETFGAAVKSVHTTIMKVEGLHVLVADAQTVFDLKNSNYLPEIMEIKRKQAVSDGFAPVCSISPNIDSRGPGWTIYRYDDNPMIDLTRVREHDLVTFVHSNGFLAKVDPTADIRHLLDLVALSIVPPLVP
jgi:hypothetical protein